jgi:FtsP/CotA-like multicopper oxidase with cupredoxin domain
MKKTIMLSFLSGVVVIGAAYGGYAVWKNDADETAVMQGVEKRDERGVYREFLIEAKETEWQWKEDAKKITAWTFNGTVPGTEIRVKEGQRLKVVLKNTLEKPVSIHWHGYPVPNAMDGIPGVTQNAVQPGESYTYEFTAAVPGTYWYHSHQESADQVDRGLYGALIVEPKEQAVTYDRDYTLILDEWNPEMFASSGGSEHSQHGGSSNSGGTDHSQHGGSSNSGGMDHSQHGGTSLAPSHDELMRQMYSIFTVNGKAGDEIKPLQVKKGEKVKLRFINAGYQTHKLNLQNQSFRITHVDGQAVENGSEVIGQLLAIAPGERYDIEFTATGDNFAINCQSESQARMDMKIQVQVDGNTKRVDAQMNADLPVLDITTYGQAKPVDPSAKYDIDTKLVLNNVVVQKDGKQEEVYTINGKISPDIPPLQVKKGQKVKVTMTNEGSSDHPMHLHGHFFQVLSKNGQLLQGSTLLKDTLNVRPGETYEVVFVADNDGNWMFHCHDLHHAAAGMMTTVEYEGYKPNFTPDPNAGNIAE